VRVGVRVRARVGARVRVRVRARARARVVSRVEKGAGKVLSLCQNKEKGARSWGIKQSQWGKGVSQGGRRSGRMARGSDVSPGMYQVSVGVGRINEMYQGGGGSASGVGQSLEKIFGGWDVSNGVCRSRGNALKVLSG
jgi:hypothetical protein